MPSKPLLAKGPASTTAITIQISEPKTAAATELKEANWAAGFHFFDRDSMRFFRSRVIPTVYAGPGGVFFVTSEQFDEKSTRNFTVRKFDPKTGGVDTLGEFNKSSRADALRAARNAAKSSI